MRRTRKVYRGGGAKKAKKAASTRRSVPGAKPISFKKSIRLNASQMQHKKSSKETLGSLYRSYLKARKSTRAYNRDIIKAGQKIMRAALKTSKATVSSAFALYRKVLVVKLYAKKYDEYALGKLSALQSKLLDVFRTILEDYKVINPEVIVSYEEEYNKILKKRFPGMTFISIRNELLKQQSKSQKKAMNVDDEGGAAAGAGGAGAEKAAALREAIAAAGAAAAAAHTNFDSDNENNNNENENNNSNENIAEQDNPHLNDLLDFFSNMGLKNLDMNKDEEGHDISELLSGIQKMMQ